MYRTIISKDSSQLHLPQYMIDNISGRNQRLLATHYAVLSRGLDFLAICTPYALEEHLRRVSGVSAGWSVRSRLERSVWSRTDEVERGRRGLIIPAHLLNAIGLENGGSVDVLPVFDKLIVLRDGSFNPQ